MLKGLLKDTFLTEEERSVLASIECQLHCYTCLALYLHLNSNAHEMASRFYRLTNVKWLKDTMFLSLKSQNLFCK